MSETLFGRSARVIFGRDKTSGLGVTGLRIKFKVTKTAESNPNKAEIAVYNMNRESRALAEQDGNIVILECGYGLTSQGLPKLEGLFIGDVARALTIKDSVDYVTTFECGDGEAAHQNSIIDVAFGPGTQVGDVFNSLKAKLTGVGQGVQTPIARKSFANGFVASGTVRSIMDQLTADMDLEWSIQDGQLQIIPRGKTTGEEAVRLAPDTGLIGRPKKKNDGIEVRSLLQPKLKPGKPIVMDSETIKGVYRIEKVIHTGDTHSNEWYSDIELGEVTGG